MESQHAATKALGSRARLALGTMRAVWAVGRVERAEGSLGKTLALLRERRTLAFARDWTFAELLEWAAAKYRYAPFLEYESDGVVARYSFNDVNRRANRVARRLQDAGVRAG
ncbi:MAG TPA: hypothetical protein VH044_00910, partial [Polyangiaceae bacterium]|nr:hypothetical protein [Polyangiaceae bacterium]